MLAGCIGVMGHEVEVKAASEYAGKYWCSHCGNMIGQNEISSSGHPQNKCQPIYTVYLDANGGSCELSYIGVPCNYEYAGRDGQWGWYPGLAKGKKNEDGRMVEGDPVIPTRNGCTFAGWNTKPDGSGKAVPADGNVEKTTECDETLYAQWNDYQAPTAAITVNTSNGVSQSLTLSGTDNAGITSYYWGTSSNPSASLYSPVSPTMSLSVRFFRDISEAGTYYLFIKDAAGNVSSAKSVTVYGLTLNPDGGSTSFGGSSHNSSFTIYRASGSTVALPTASKSGYTFQSWSGSTGNYTVSSSKTLTASYKDSSAPSAAITVNSSNGVSQSLTLSGTDNAGITSYYWGTSSKPAANAYTSVSSTKNLSAGKDISEAGTYYLITKDAAGNVSSAKSVTIYGLALNPDGGSTTFGGSSHTNSFTIYRASGSTVALPTASKSGYRFNSWSGSTGNYTVSSSKTLTASYTDNSAPSAAITVNSSNGVSQSLTLSGTDNAGITSYYWGTSSNPSAGSYTSVSSTTSLSVNRNISSAGTYYLFTKDAAGNVSSAKSVTVYALTLNPDGGSTTFGGSSHTNSFTIYRTSGSTVALPSASKPGCRFNSWSGSTGNYTVSATKTLTASYTDSSEPSAVITVNSSNGVSQSVTLSGTDNTGITSYYWGTNSKPAANAYTSVTSTKSLSVNKTVSDAGTYYLFTKDAAGNIQKASKTFFRLSLNPDGGKMSFGGSSYSSTLAICRASGQTVSLPSPAKTGYTFQSWGGYTGTYAVTSTTTLKADYNAVSYNISYDLAGGKVDTANPATYTVASHTITLNNPVKKGYTFTGWTGSCGNVPVKTVTIATGSTGNKSYTANWQLDYSYDEATGALTVYNTDSAPLASMYRDYPDAKKIVFASGVDQISNVAFDRFGSLEAVVVNAKNADRATEDGIVYSADKATLLYCPPKHADNPSISKSCGEIRTGAFDGCSLKNVNIPYSVRKIRTDAFRNCALNQIAVKNPDCELEKGAIPASTERGAGFQDSSVITYCGDNGIEYQVLTEIPDGYFENETAMTKFDIPGNVASIGEKAFDGCVNLTDIGLGNVTDIGAYAFNNTGLEKVSIPDGVKTIQAKAFMNTPDLAEVELSRESSLAEIGESAFAKSGIGSGEGEYTLYIPASVKTIGKGAFNGDKDIDRIQYESMETGTAWDSTVNTIPENTVIGCYYGSRPYGYAKEHGYRIAMRIGYEADGTTSCNGDEEALDLLVRADIGPVLKDIGKNAFSDAGELKSVTFSKDSALGYIGDNAFSKTPITEIALPAAVTGSGVGILQDCQDLETADLGGITNVPADTFNGCKALTEVTGTEKWHSIGDRALAGTAVKEFVAGEDVESLGEEVFAGSALETLVVKNPNCVFPESAGLVPDATAIKGYANSTADIYSQTCYDKDCESLGKSAYTIYLNATGGTGGTEKVFAVNGMALSGIKVPKKTDHIFMGYYLYENGNGPKYYGADGTGARTWDDTSNITLYAHWIHETYTVKYDGNRADTGTMEDSIFDTSTDVVLRKNAYKRDGYRFLGWALSPDATEPEYTDREDVNGLAGAGETVTLYAVWKTSRYTIRYEANGGEGVIPPQTADCDADVRLAGNTFRRDGYTFVGWSESSSAGIPEYETGRTVRNLAEPGSTAVLYAVWGKGDIPAHTVQFNGNSGKMEEISSPSYEGYGTVIPDVIPEREGFEFLGWTTVQGSDEVEYHPGDRISKDTDVTLHAVWGTKGDTEYTIHVYTQKADGTYAVKDRRMSADAGKKVTLIPGTDFVIGDGYYLDNSASTLSGTSAEGMELNVYRNRNEVGITYNVNADDATIDKITTATALWGNTMTLNAPMPQRSGYTFEGWATEADGTSAVTKVMLSPQGTVVYAIWKAKPAQDIHPGATGNPDVTQRPAETAEPMGTDDPDRTAGPTVTEAAGTKAPVPTETVGTEAPEPTKTTETGEPAPTKAAGTETPEPTKATETEDPAPTEAVGTDAPAVTGTGAPAPTKAAGTDAPAVTGTGAPAPTKAAGTDAPVVTETEEPAPTKATETEVPAVTGTGKPAPTEAVKTMAPDESIWTRSPDVTSEPSDVPTDIPTTVPTDIPAAGPTDIPTTVPKPQPNNPQQASKVTINGVTYKVSGRTAKAVKVNAKKVRTRAKVNGRKVKRAVICRTVTIGGKKYKVTGIGKNAFKNCGKIKYVRIKTKALKTIGKNAFKGLNKKAVFRVPAKKLTKYKKLIARAKTGYWKTMKVEKYVKKK